MHRPEGFTAGVSETNPTFSVNANGSASFASTVAVAGAMSVAGALSVTGAIAQTGNLAITGTFSVSLTTVLTGSVAIGGAAPTNPQAFVSVTPPANASGVTAAQSYSLFTVAAAGATTIPTGTAPIVATARFEEPNITATGTVTAGVTVYIAAAPTEGSTNYALWVDADTTRLDGNFATGALVLGAAAPTNPQSFCAIVPAANATGVTAAQSYSLFTIAASAATVIPTGTAPVAASMIINEPNLTATGTITCAATVYIADAPTEGTGNAALWVNSGNIVCKGTTLLAQNATSGFLWIPACATGAPSGTPAGGSTGSRALVWDSVGFKLSVYDGAWKQSSALT